MTAAPWTERRERGSAALVRLMIWLTLGLGWPVGQALLYPITALFLPVLAGRAQRFQPLPWPRSGTARHPTRNIPPPVHLLLRAARPAVPAVQPAAALSDRYDRAGHVTSALAQGGDAYCSAPISAASRCCAPSPGSRPVPVNILMYRANTGAYSRLMERLDPTLADAIIEIGTPEAMLRVRESLDAGRDGRHPRGSCTRRTEDGVSSVPRRTGAVADRPVVCCAPRWERRSCCSSVSAPERGATRSISSRSPTASSLQRSRRAEDIAGWVSRYAERLEAHCRIYPFNWFNFYDFWEPGRMPLHRRRFGPSVAAGDHCCRTAARRRNHRQQQPEAAIDELMQMLARVPESSASSSRSRSSPC